METTTAIFEHAKSALNDIETGKAEKAALHLRRFIMPALAELTLAQNPPPPESELWNELVMALRNSND